jgi:hypothetical protein
LAKRGVALSLLLLVGLFQQGRALSAGETLCVALDGALPGATCAGLVPAAAAAVPATAVLAQAGLTAGLLASKALLGAGVAAVVCAGVVTWTVLRAPAPASVETPARPAVVAPKVVVSEAAPKVRVDHPVPAPEVKPVRATVKPVEEALPPQEPEAGKDAAEKDEGIPLTQVPENVRVAAEAVAPGIRFDKIERKKKKDQVVYEFEGRVEDRKWEIQVSEDGRVLKLREDNDNDNDKDGDKDDHKDGDAKKGVPPPAAPKAEAEF